MTFGRLAQDNEITAVRAGGIKIVSLFVPVLILGLLFSLLSLHLNNSVIPQAKHRFEVLSRNLGMKKPALLLRARVFIKDFQGYRLFLEKVKGNSLSGVHIWQLRKGGPPLTIFARRGEVTSDPKRQIITFKLIDGTREEVNPEVPGEYSRSRFSIYYFNLTLPAGEKRIDKRPGEMTIGELRAAIRELKGKKVYPLLVEINRKLSLSFACLTFILIGAPLGVMAKKGGKSIGFGLSFLLILIYYIMMMLGESLGEKGMVSPALAMWTPTILLSGIGLFLIFRRIER
jgi:lipopolysaccharide export LptBFGC system permease protein LptF